MDTTESLLNKLAARNGNCSDYRLSKILGVTPSTVYNYRSGRSCLADDIAVKIARELELPPAYVLACMMAERAKTPTIKRIWSDLAKDSLRTAAAIVAALVLSVLAYPSTGYAAAGHGHDIHYAQLWISAGFGASARLIRLPACLAASSGSQPPDRGNR